MKLNIFNKIDMTIYHTKSKVTDIKLQISLQQIIIQNSLSQAANANSRGNDLVIA